MVGPQPFFFRFISLWTIPKIGLGVAFRHSSPGAAFIAANVQLTSPLGSLIFIITFLQQAAAT